MKKKFEIFAATQLKENTLRVIMKRAHLQNSPYCPKLFSVQHEGYSRSLYHNAAQCRVNFSENFSTLTMFAYSLILI